MTSQLNFADVSLAEEHIPIGGKEYVLREASGGAATKYRNAVLACTILGVGGRAQTVKGMASVEPLLVSLCLFEVLEKGERPVKLSVIEGWPARVQEALFERAKRISNLEEEQAEREQLIKALALPGSPISVADLEKWISGLGEEYSDLQIWFEPSPEEKAKNELSGMTNGSD